MITKNYTPGPWSAISSTQFEDLFDYDPGMSDVALGEIALMAEDGDNQPWFVGRFIPEMNAPKYIGNARLISAATELVEASELSLHVLTGYLERMTDGDCDPVLVAEIEAAIKSTREALTKAGVLTTKS